MTNVPTLRPEALEFYTSISSSVLTDSMGRLAVGAWMDDVHALDLKWRVCGRVRTLQYGVRTGVQHSTHSIYSFAETLAPGDILVIGAQATRGWLLGENIAHFCQSKGVAGIVTDGRIRDRAELLEMTLPIFCKGASARPHKPDVAVVAVDIPLECGGAHVRPGDLIIGDFDGIAIAPHAAVDALIEEARDISALEEAQGISIQQGKSLAEIRAIADRKGVRKGPPFSGS